MVCRPDCLTSLARVLITPPAEVTADDEIFAITSAGGVIRTRADEVKQSGRQTMGVRLMNLAAGDSVVALARNAESLAEGDQEPSDSDEEDGPEPADGEADLS